MLTKVAPGVVAPTQRMLFGLSLDAVTLDDAVRRCRLALDGDQRVLVGVVNAAKVVNLRSDSFLRDSLLECDLLVADGQSVVWASRILRRPLPERVAGIDLFESLLDLANREGRSIYLLGAQAEVLAKVVDVVEHRWPDLRVVGARDGYFTTEETARVAEDIRRAAPDMLFLGMTSPKKEIFLGHVRKRPRCPRASRGRRFVRCHGRPDPPSPRAVAAPGHGVGLPTRPGARAPVAALPDDQHRIHRLWWPTTSCGPPPPMPTLGAAMDDVFSGRVAVIGLGYIGLPTAVVLATRGVDVVGVDVNPRTVVRRRTRQVPFVEPDLAVAVKGAVSMGRLKAVDRAARGRRLHHRGADAVQRRPHGGPQLHPVGRRVDRPQAPRRGGGHPRVDLAAGHLVADQPVARRSASGPAASRTSSTPSPTSMSRTARSGCCPAAS